MIGSANSSGHANSEARQSRLAGGMRSTGMVAAIRRAVVENAALKLVALVLALTIFVLVHSEDDDVYYPKVSVTYSLEKDRVLVSKRVDEVQITIRGSKRRIKRLQKQRLESIHVDTSRLSNSDLILSSSMVTLPDGVEFISANPPSIHLEFDLRLEKMLSVEVDTIGSPGRGFRMGSAVSSPTEVRVSGARKVLRNVRTISTEKVNLTGRSRPFEGAVALVAGQFEVLDAPSVDVSIQIIEALEARALEPKKITIRGAEGNDADISGFSVRPGQAEVTMFGAVHALEAIDVDKIQVFVEVGPSDFGVEGPRQVELRVEPKLSDIAYKIDPTHVLLRPPAQ